MIRLRSYQGNAILPPGPTPVAQKLPVKQIIYLLYLQIQIKHITHTKNIIKIIKYHTDTLHQCHYMQFSSISHPSQYIPNPTYMWIAMCHVGLENLHRLGFASEPWKSGLPFGKHWHRSLTQIGLVFGTKYKSKEGSSARGW